MCVVSDWMTGDWGGWWVDLFCLRPRHGSNIGANNKKKKGQNIPPDRYVDGVCNLDVSS